jgi:hypothetical protein
MRRLAALGLVAALGGCGSQRAACGPSQAVLENASSLAVEQLYLAPAAGQAWGTDLLGQAPALPASGRMPVALDGPGPWRLRLVWVNGRATELRSVDGCTTRRITIRDDILIAG